MNHNNHRAMHAAAWTGGVTCETCDSLLDAYLDAELATAAVRRLYPEIWRHLQTCPTCAAQYVPLYKTLAEFQLHSFGYSPGAEWVDLSFLRISLRPGNDLWPSPWHVYLRSQLLGEPFLLRLSFSRWYIQKFIRHANAFARRAVHSKRHPNHPDVYLLLKDHIPLYEQTTVAQIVALPVRQQLGLWRFKATLTSPMRLPPRLQATFQWGAYQHACRVTAAGEAELGSVPLECSLPTPTTQHSYTVTFETPV